MGEAVEQPPRHRRRQQRLPAGDHADRLHELDRPDVLKDEAAGAGAKRLEDVLVGVIGGEDQDPCGIAGRDESARGLDAVHVRHPDVHQDHVGSRVAGERVMLLGGRFTAGPRPEGGFAIRASIPLDGAPR